MKRTQFIRIILATLMLSACILSPVAAQNKLDSIALRAIQVGQVMQQERVYLHFDNTAYYLGETMWFKAYVSFGSDNRPSTLSKVLYVELVAPEGYVVETKKYKINDDGSCYGEIQLNPLLLSGYYEVRAYTRYMLNWDKSAIFSRVFAVFDKVNADNWDFKNMLDRRRGFSSNGKWISTELPEASLTFFPEGGNLVADTESRVAYELRGKEGLFGEEEITIFENGAPLLKTTPVHMGKGHFIFTPKEGAEYRAEVTIKNEKGKPQKHKFKLPAAEKEGVVMQVEENDSNVVVKIQSRFSNNQELGFVILHRGTMGYYKKFSAATTSTSFTFAKDSLREGVNRAVIFADSITPLAERHFFITHDTLQPTDNRTVKLNVTANGYQPHNATLAPHEKVTIRVKRDDGRPITSESDLSLTVSDATSNQKTSYSHNLYTYLLLGSEIKGYIPDAAQYFDPENSARKEQLDLIMLTHGWTSYDWGKLTRTFISDFQPIERGITLKGRFFLKTANQKIGKKGEVNIIPQKDILTRLDIAPNGKDVTTTTFRTDSTGSFVVQFDDFYDTRVASLKPQTAMRQGGSIAYQFALDRYYSPGFRLYDYWENHLGKPMSKSMSDSIIKMNPFEYMLSSMEVVAKKKHEFNTRPPHSEMRFNYLDEWEYAQDVTYLNILNPQEDEIFRDVKANNENIRATIYELADSSIKISAKEKYHILKESKLISNDTHLVLDGQSKDVEKLEEIIATLYNCYCLDNDRNEDVVTRAVYSEHSMNTRYIGNMRYGTESVTIPVKHEYDHILTANDVVLSAMRRHNYNWAYWVQLMVVQGDYRHDETPVPDMEYLRGLANADKMTNFKEFIIRSDENTRKQFENRGTHWAPLTRMLDNKIPIQKFYRGFLSQSYLYSGNGIDGCPDGSTFIEQLYTAGGGEGINYPINPNYVACLIPYSDEERTQGVVPEFAATGSTMRYTSVQGYSESKQFYSPDYSKITPQEKDYRRTLCWVPEVKIVNGEAIAEFYNSSSCSNIIVNVAGRDYDVIYGNDETFYTRFNERKRVQNVAEQQNKQETEPAPLDSATLAACEHHHNKALIYYNQKRYKESITMFAELAKYNYAPSMYYIGLCYLNGTGLTKNLKHAFNFMQKAAELGDATAKYDLAMMLDNGIGTERDEASAHENFTIAATLDEPRALLEMYNRYLNGKMVEQSNETAEKLLQKAASLHYPPAQLEYGIFLINNGREGLQHIKSAAKEKHVKAMLYMYDHEYNAGNYKQAYNYAKELHLMDNHEGTKRMADCYYSGKGVSRDKSLAKDLYREAATAGNKEAEKILKEL